MGCDYYHIKTFDPDDETSYIHFSEMDDTVGCLCTFPHNDAGWLSVERLRSLAMLGAAVVMLQHGEIFGPVFLPNGLGWVKDEIFRLLPDEKAE